MNEDPWAGSRRAAEQKQARSTATQEIITRNERIRASEAKRKAPKLDKPYKPVFGL